MLLSFLLLACGGNPPPPKAEPSPKTEVAPAPTPAAPTLRASHSVITTELRTRPMSALVRAPSAASPPTGAPGPKTAFGLYVLALTWEPAFCCDSPSKGQCTGLNGSFGADHLTIHGLWPNYNDQESKEKGEAYPTFCGDYASCEKSNVAACDPDTATIPADMATYGPGYVTDNYFLADHEWPKHGSCTGLDSGTYFQAAINQLKSLPGDQGTPDILRNNVGGSVKRTDLAAAFGQADAVMLSCDSSCTLKQVEVCFGHDDNNMPTGLVSCPDNARKTAYDNSCELNNCDQVKILKAGDCGSSGGGGGGGGGCAADKGQGPACTDDASCTSQQYLRCAKSGCCTSVPLN